MQVLTAFVPLGCNLSGYPLCMKCSGGKRLYLFYFHNLQKVSYFASSWGLMNTILAQFDWLCHVVSATLNYTSVLYSTTCCLTCEMLKSRVFMDLVNSFHKIIRFTKPHTRISMCILSIPDGRIQSMLIP